MRTFPSIRQDVESAECLGLPEQAFPGSVLPSSRTVHRRNDAEIQGVTEYQAIHQDKADQVGHQDLHVSRGQDWLRSESSALRWET